MYQRHFPPDTVFEELMESLFDQLKEKAVSEEECRAVLESSSLLKGIAAKIEASIIVESESKTEEKLYYKVYYSDGKPWGLLELESFDDDDDGVFEWSYTSYFPRQSQIGNPIYISSFPTASRYNIRKWKTAKGALSFFLKKKGEDLQVKQITSQEFSSAIEINKSKGELFS
jgi:hypothetical protein